VKNKTNLLEGRRLALQSDLDAGKSQSDRNRMGQFATPTGLAIDMLQYAKTQLKKNERIRFLDPAIGTGSFYSALLDVFPKRSITRAVGYEIDPYYGAHAAELWGGTGLQVHMEDFTRGEPPLGAEKFNLLICNPPYVRHHHILNEEKHRLRSLTRDACGVEINGMAGLYCHFLGLCHAWMAEGGLAGWLMPSEFMDVNYGAAIKRYLLDKVTLEHIHRFDPSNVQFGDALVSSAIVWFRKKIPPRNHEPRFSFGGTLERPQLERRVAADVLRRDPKWTRYPVKTGYDVSKAPVLGEFFTVKRGLATGNNSYFILSDEEIRKRSLPAEVFRPILPSPRYLPEDEIAADWRGNPVLARRLFLLDCQLGEAEIEKRYPNLWAYLEEGKAEGVADRYLCRHRKPWFSQENRRPAPFVCTYLGRSDTKSGRPFRFILNHSQATAANVYLMLYPKQSLHRALQEYPAFKEKVWKVLNEICPKAMLGEGRVYGGGLYKLEPKELAKVPAAAIAELLLEAARLTGEQQIKPFEASAV